MSALLELDAAAFRYAGAATAVGPFALRVEAGELHVVRGPSGCGKTTLARLLSGSIPHLYRGDLSGRVRVGGDDARYMPQWQHCREVGLVAQNPASQLLGATVADEVAFGLETLGIGSDAVRARRDEALRAFALEGLAEREPTSLSGGEQQLVLLAAMAARRPRALVLDEPCAMLDALGRAQVRAALGRLRTQGTAMVLNDHRPSSAWLPTRVHDLPAVTLLAHDELPAWPHSSPAFQIRTGRLRVRFGRRPVLDGVDLDLSGGKVVAISGRNGAGKTTLLRVLAGLQPADGRIVCEGSPSPRWGICFQNPDRQFFNPSVRAELEFGRAPGATPSVDDLVALLGLGGVADSPPLLLSEGEKKRLALGVMLGRPALGAVCLDEPTVGQDDAHRRRVGRIVRHMAAHGMLVVVATHDLDWAAEWADEAALLEHGRVVAQIAAADLRTAPAAWVAAGLIAVGEDAVATRPVAGPAGCSARGRQPSHSQLRCEEEACGNATSPA